MPQKCLGPDDDETNQNHALPLVWQIWSALGLHKKYWMVVK